MKLRRLVETCAGSAVISQAVIRGAEEPILGMQGGKAGYIRSILEVLGLELGGGADELLLIEPSMYGVLWQLLLTDARQQILARLEALSAADPETLWRHYASQAVPVDRLEAAVRFAVLQFWSYARKPIYPILRSPMYQAEAWCWKTWGFNRSEAYNGEYRQRRGEGVGRRDRRLPDVIRRIQALPDDVSSWRVLHASALSVSPAIWGGPGVLVYIDPPYADREGYGARNRIARLEVLGMARAWAATGSTVAVSEAVPLEVDLGRDHWVSVRLPAPRGRGRNNYGATEEWLTIHPREAAWPAGN